MAAKFFTGLPLDGPDPECVRGFGEQALEKRKMDGSTPKPDGDHSHRTERGPRRDGKPASRGIPITLSLKRPDRPPVSACEENPLAGFSPDRPL